MIHTQIAFQVAQTLQKSADRYDQIWAIKEILLKDHPILATDRETIDEILDILFEKHQFNG
jgi:predicted ABC-type transport system involved in lysophospholipase L1 biosynthesis ATPase subunit